MAFSAKTVVIPGGASGIGAALAKRLVDVGAGVAIQNAAQVQQAASQLGCLSCARGMWRRRRLR